jgi:hypothetical protein
MEPERSITRIVVSEGSVAFAGLKWIKKAKQIKEKSENLETILNPKSVERSAKI